MKTFQLLKPLPIKRDENTHRYVNIETKQWMSYSTTEVCSELTEEDKENIEKWRSQWQPRGEKCHECLAEHMLGNGKIDPDEYSGFAFGLGIDRIALLLHQIDDIRLLSENDVRFLDQFKSSF